MRGCGVAGSRTDRPIEAIAALEMPPPGGYDFAPTIEDPRGCSSVVERHVANVNVEGSTPFTRFSNDPASDDTPGRPFLGACAHPRGWLGRRERNVDANARQKLVNSPDPLAAIGSPLTRMFVTPGIGGAWNTTLAGF
jgi:hypothetical protein